MSDDPRALLDDAARARTSCQLRVRKGSWIDGTFVRVDKAGVVLSAETGRFEGGEDVRVWLQVDQVPYTFVASVIRAGVPLPDPEGTGLLLGFIDGWRRADAPSGSSDSSEALDPQVEIEVLAPNGGGVRLLDGPGQLVELRVDELVFAVPASVPLKFVEGGTVRIVITSPTGAHDIDARVHIEKGDGHWLYSLRFQATGEGHLAAIHHLRAALA